MAKKKIKETIAEITEEFLTNEGLELYNVEFVNYFWHDNNNKIVLILLASLCETTSLIDILITR